MPLGYLGRGGFGGECFFGCQLNLPLRPVTMRQTACICAVRIGTITPYGIDSRESRGERWYPAGAAGFLCG